MGTSLLFSVLCCFVAAPSPSQDDPIEPASRKARATDSAAATEGAPCTPGSETAATSQLARPAAPGLRVYVDPATGQLTSNPPARSSSLRIVEQQSKPRTGDVEREIVEIPGVGIGVYVGDLFVHSMTALPATDREVPACATDRAKEKAETSGLAVAVQ